MNSPNTPTMKFSEHQEFTAIKEAINRLLLYKHQLQAVKCKVLFLLWKSMTVVVSFTGLIEPLM